MIPDSRNTALLDNIDTQMSALITALRTNQDAYYALGYMSSVMMNHLRGETKAAQKRFLEDIEYFLKSTNERYADSTEQNVIYERVS